MTKATHLKSEASIYNLLLVSGFGGCKASTYSRLLVSRLGGCRASNYNRLRATMPVAGYEKPDVTRLLRENNASTTNATETTEATHRQI